MSNESAENPSGFPVKPDPSFPDHFRSTGPDSSASRAKYNDLGDLPTGYGEVFLIARDPHWLFTYWDFDYSKFPSARQLFLQVRRGESIEAVIEINDTARNWYLPVQTADADYWVSFGYKDQAGISQIVSTAGPAHTPRETVSENWDSLFATLPFHLSFNFLHEVIAAAKAQGQPLAEALARLQQGVSVPESVVSARGLLHIRMLQTLLGTDLLTQLFSMNAAQMEEFLRRELIGELKSEASGELLAKGRLAALFSPAGINSLFSLGLHEQLSSAVSSSSTNLSSESVTGETVSSGASAGSSETLVSSFGSELFEVSSETLASFSELGGLFSQLFGSESGALFSLLTQLGGLSSVSLGGVTSEMGSGAAAEMGSLAAAEIGSGMLSSGPFSSELGFQRALAGWETAFSAFGGSPETAFSGFSSLWETAYSEFASSWQTALQGLAASWESVTSGLGSLEISSFSAHLASWSGLEMGLSSMQFVTSSWSGLEFGSPTSELFTESSLASPLGATWSAEPFGIGSPEILRRREAEVIFYGGIHPDARVTIGGQPIHQQSDGTFHCDFKFQDDDFEVPVIAVSPDGVETRKLILRFSRETAPKRSAAAVPQSEVSGEPVVKKRF